MITQQLISPKSIVVVGASNDVTKPGGKVVKNLIQSGFSGKVHVVNPKDPEIQGIKSFAHVSELPQCDLAVLAIAAKYCPETVETLARDKGTRAFIVLSAGFHEESHEGALLEQAMVQTMQKYGASLIGPNCIGMMNHNHTSVFTTPIPKMSPSGVDFISGSGATAVFIMESSIPKGLTFSSVWSVGNSAQIGVEDVLAYLDETFDPASSSRVKLLYVESINKPDLLLKHATSLIHKGCRIAAIKAGSSAAGSRAASSHTGALASPDAAVGALFHKAGIVRCHSREELATVGCIFMHKPLLGKNIAIVTHAGGPAVMLTDALSTGGLEIPKLQNEELLSRLFPGSSVSNPIDFLATGTASQLGDILDTCENGFEQIDGIAVIFGSPGLTPVYDVYDLLDEKMKKGRKPIFPILPSVVNVKDEIEHFIRKGRIFFPDEVFFGQALAKIYSTPKPFDPQRSAHAIDTKAIRRIVESASNGYLSPELVQGLLDAAGIHRAGEAVADQKSKAIEAATQLGLPVVMKVVGPVHKSDVGGVVLNVGNLESVGQEFDRLMKIPQAKAVLIQPMLTGTQVFIGAKREGAFGHMVLCGLGGIFIEVLKDVSTALAPVGIPEAREMVRSLKSYPIIQGIRGQQGMDEDQLADAIERVSLLCMAAPEIAEMDINPLLGTPEQLIAVDARIRIEKENNGKVSQ